MWELWDRSKKPQVQPYKQSSMGYNVIMNSTLPTEIGYDNGKLVTSNPTKQPDHDFLMDTLAAAKLSNTFDNVEFEIKNRIFNSLSRRRNTNGGESEKLPR